MNVVLKPFVPDLELSVWDLRDKKDYKYPVNYGHGIRWKDKNGRQCESFLSPNAFRNGKRIVYRKWSTFVGGITFGAMHYYASLEAYGPSGKYCDTGEIFSMGGYGPEREKIAKWLDWINIKATRRLTKVEKDMGGDVLGKIGEYTERFNSEEDAKDAALRLFPKRFSPGCWILLDHDDCNLVLGET